MEYLLHLFKGFQIRIEPFTPGIRNKHNRIGSQKNILAAFSIPNCPRNALETHLSCVMLYCDLLWENTIKENKPIFSSK